MVQTDRNVTVTVKSGLVREFDLVVGADGPHSRIRELAFGPEQESEKYLGFKVAAFIADGYKPRDELAYIMFTQVGQQVGRFSLRENRAMFHFTFADENTKIPTDVAPRGVQALSEPLRAVCIEKAEHALRLAGSFAPKSKLSLFVRNQIRNLMSLPGVAELAMGNGFVDKIALPEY